MYASAGFQSGCLDREAHGERFSEDPYGDKAAASGRGLFTVQLSGVRSCNPTVTGFFACLASCDKSRASFRICAQSLDMVVFLCYVDLRGQYE